MNMKKICAAVAVAAVMTIAASASQAADVSQTPGTTTTTTTAPAPAPEKCYGIAKAGKEVAVELPAGVCNTLVNGSLTAPAPQAPAADKK